MEVQARAPGKIILSGEHAVVHGSTAVAASINLYTYVTLRFSTPSDNQDSLKLELKDEGLDFSWSTTKLKELFPESTEPQSPKPPSFSVESAKSIESLIEGLNIPEAKISIASGVSAFLWLYTSIHGFKPATVSFTSELPMGSGLGSSASFCVALAAALLACTDFVSLDLKQQGWQSFQERQLDLVNKWAFEGEKIIHGKPSGIDNSVSAYERTLRHPEAMAFVFNAVDSISKELALVLQSTASDDVLSVTEKEEKIEELMEMNQGLLQSMGVSHVTIETVLRTTLKYKLASKLTGAGGGGCVLTLLPTLLSGFVVQKVIAELESCGFQCFTAEIGGKGVEINFDVSS
ncbi:hypothetical protein PIB30_024623 [Stylosanthes scabra]|uniref:mevalonate kinase n=1 Tax=Stylosanthes scabra TaxID=79078 RepID=A0ABU6W9E9_9FABA|nr:hypothetical protein [Stylosanthes scabra]